jgi:hypothetical protein
MTTRGSKTRRVDIQISIEYDESKFPEDDMRWAAEKVAECEQIWNIGYDSDSFDITESKVTHTEAN